MLLAKDQLNNSITIYIVRRLNAKIQVRVFQKGRFIPTGRGWIIKDNKI